MHLCIHIYSLRSLLMRVLLRKTYQHMFRDCHSALPMFRSMFRICFAQWGGLALSNGTPVHDSTFLPTLVCVWAYSWLVASRGKWMVLQRHETIYGTPACLKVPPRAKTRRALYFVVSPCALCPVPSPSYFACHQIGNIWDGFRESFDFVSGANDVVVIRHPDGLMLSSPFSVQTNASTVNR